MMCFKVQNICQKLSLSHPCNEQAKDMLRVCLGESEKWTHV
jgi:hypothetical protein